MSTSQNKELLESIRGHVALLDRTSKQLIQVMDQQIRAVITANESHIERLSDMHQSVSKEFKNYESQFIAELSRLLEMNGEEEQESVRLQLLKERYPEFQSEIDQWHNLLTENTRTLQTKHDQIIELLEFAMAQNAKMMHSLYNEHHQKNTHYGVEGSKTTHFAGVAVNQHI
ncbi:MAG: hypothetical protein AAFW89_05925 [Bacteroidota bacterium]